MMFPSRGSAFSFSLVNVNLINLHYLLCKVVDSFINNKTNSRFKIRSNQETGVVFFRYIVRQITKI